MILNAFVLLLIAHVMGDVIFTSYKIAVLKRNSRFSLHLLGVGCHSGIHALFAALMLFLGGRVWLKGALLVLAVHFIIDIIRSRVDMSFFGPGRIHVKRSEFIAWVSGKSRNPEKMNMKNLWPWCLINLFDQVAHLVSLYCISLAV